MVMQHPILSRLGFGASLSLALALVASPASADITDPPASTIRVMGEASVTSPPDRAELDLGVVTRSPNPQQAAAENARVLQNVLRALRNLLGPRADIQTISYALHPDYEYPQPGGAPRITGYTATNVVRVRQDGDLTRLGAILDAATRAGANQVERIRFTLRDEGAAKANALRLAALEARTKANSLATALGVQIARVHSVEEVSLTPRPFYELAARSTVPATPILPGTIETTATVTLTLELAGRR